LDGGAVEGVIFEGGSHVLDGGVLKNVIFRRCLITYNGGALRLANVFFEDCQFDISFSGAGRKLGEVLLASNRASIELP